jgi:hypothetical protein
MDYENMEPYEALLEIIADLEAGHAQMLAAREKMSGSSLAARAGYEHLAARVNAVVVSSDAALEEASRILVEP